MKQKKIKTSKGITLLEVVIVIAIIGILMTPIYNIMFTNDKLVQKTANTITAKDAVVFVQQVLLEQIELATTMQIGRTTGAVVLEELSTSNERALYMEGGELILQKGGVSPNTQQSLCSEQLLGGFDIDIQYTDKADDVLEVSISATKGSEILYTEKIVTKLMNFKTDTNDESIVDAGTTTDYIQYALPLPVIGP